MGTLRYYGIYPEPLVMALTSETTYRRRLARSSGFLERSYDLWLTDDHILHVVRSSYSEHCKRFYLSDIQGFCIVKTAFGKGLNIIVGIVIAINAMLIFTALASWKFPAISVVLSFGVFGAIAAVLLVYNILLGPTCACNIYTAVQCERLKALGRWKKANSVIDTLRPMIEAVQDATQVPQDSEGTTETSEVVIPAAYVMKPAANPVTASATTVPEEPMTDTRVVTGFFCILCALGISSAVDMCYQHSAKNIFEGLLLVAALCCALVTLGRTRKMHILPRLYITIWCSLATLVALSLLAVPIYTYMMLLDPNIVNVPAVSITLDGFVFMVYFAVEAAVLIALGFLGLKQVVDYRRDLAGQTTGTTET